MTFLRNTIILGLVLCTIGCSALKLSYNNAPQLTYWWLNSYLDFPDHHQEDVRRELAKLHDWHYQHELPDYIRLLARLKTLALTDVEAKEVCEIVEQIRQHGRNLNTQAAYITQRMAHDFSAKQLDHLQKKFDKRNEQWREDWLDGTLEERAQYRMKEATKRFENFYGRIEEPQEKLLRQYIAHSTFNPKTSYTEILRRQQKALHILRAVESHRMSDQQANQEIADFYAQLIDPADPGYKHYLSTMTQESCTLIAALHNSTNAQQRQKAADRLQQYIDDLSNVKKPSSQ